MLAAVISFFLLIIVFGFQPFTSTLVIPSFVRVPALIVLVLCFFLVSVRKRKMTYFFLSFVPVAAVLFLFWRRGSPQSTSYIIYVIMLIALSVGLVAGIKRIPYLLQCITAFLFVLVIGFSLLSIISFIGFNFNIFPYQALRLGGFDFYEYYFNPVLGYIAPKRFENGMIGRVTLYMFEPSYLSWFLTTNFFMLNTYLRNDGWKALFIKPLVFAGAMCTFSTGAWLVFGALFSIMGFRWFMIKLAFREQTIKKTVRISLIMLVLMSLVVPAELISAQLGTSSYGDREKRMQTSLLFLATASIPELAFGRGPGFIENNSNLGESNQYIKLLIEEGLIVMLLTIGFIIACVKNNENYMLATLLFLNSVVILWTPLFILNLISCKFGWGDTTAYGRNAAPLGDKYI